MAEILKCLEERLENYMKTRTYPNEIATTFNFVLYDEFQEAKLKPIFVGQYFVDPANPEQTRVYCHQGTEACSPIPIERGVIGRAVRTGEDQYVPDVEKDPLHVSCDSSMEGSELVLLSWSDPTFYSVIKKSSYERTRDAYLYLTGKMKKNEERVIAPLGVLDIDLNVKNALSERDIERLKKIWLIYGKRIFPGEINFYLGGKIYKHFPK